MGKVAKGVSRAFAVNEGGTVSRALGGSQGVALAIGLVAAVAMPFALPAIAGAIGASLAVSPLIAYTIAGGLYGAATGALSGSMTGNAGRGAAIGGAAGAAGGFVQGGGLNALFGPTPTEAAAAGAQANYAPGAVSTEALAPIEGVAGGLELPLPPEFLTPEQAAALSASTEGATAAAAAAPATGVGSAAGGASTTAAGGASTTAAGGALPPKPEAATGSWWDRFASGFAGNTKNPSITTAEGFGRAASGLVSPSGVLAAGQLAMTMFNKPPEGLTPQERAYVDETAALAGTNRAMFESRVAEARRLLARGTANPEQAYASASGGYQRRARSAGLRSPEDMRRAMLEGARAGSQAVPAEEGRAYSATVAGLSAMPGSAPAGPAAYALGPYRDAEQRQREYQTGIGRSLGGLASAMGGRSSLYG